jgi:tRNA(Met) cytidine acetyltransferase
MVVLHGELMWAEQSYLQYIQEISCDKENVQSLVFSEHCQVSSKVNRKTYSHVLGTESDAVFFVDEALNVDALTALAGTLQKGGIIFVWLNRQTSTKQYSAFAQRLLNKIDQMTLSWVISQSQIELPVLDFNKVNTNGSIAPYKEQTCLIEELYQTLTSKSESPFVVTADRGRGKSSALGMLVARLLSDLTQSINIIITAPNRASLNVFYTQLIKHLPKDSNYTLRNAELALEKSSLKFLPVDEAVKSDMNKHILIVDEAAGVPVYLLTKLLSQFKQCIFSSTVYGYEGAGKGFSLKFLPWVATHYPDFIHRHLKQPIRWNQGDPLEQLLFDVCLLNAEINQFDHRELTTLKKDETTIACLSQKELANNESLLRDVFSIFVTAHYQTKPSDLKILLENPNIRLFAASNSGMIIGVTLAMVEGNLEPRMIDAVKQGKRRIKNQFLPQSILTQCQEEQAFDYSYLRVMRIAVHPQLQGEGVGSQMLVETEKWAKRENIDCIGTSYAANPMVCRFWFSAGFTPFRIGFKADASSGEHSILMLKSISYDSESFTRGLTAKFYESFDYLLVDEYRELSIELVQLVLCHNTLNTTLEAQDRRNVIAFAEGSALYSYVVLSLHKWLLHYLTYDSNPDKELEVLIARILMKHSIAEVCEAYSFKGKKALNQFLMKKITDSDYLKGNAN